MAEIILMPKMGLTMTEGKIGKWLKEEGEKVLLDEPLVKIETDKIVNEVNATSEGTLLKIIVQRGEKQEVKGPICIIGEIGEDISSLLVEKFSKKKETEEEKIKEKKVKKEKVDGGIILASPIAKRLAREKGYDLNLIEGTGPNGRIVEKDILNFKIDKKSSPTAKNVAKKLGVDINKINKATRVMKEDVYKEARKNSSRRDIEIIEERVDMSPMRRVISERMSESWNVSPAVTYELKVDTTMLKSFKKQITKKYKVTYTDLMVKIVSQVLLEYPLLNCKIDKDQLIMRNYVNMGVAVALDEGLIVPVVKYSNIMELEELSIELKELADKAKNNELVQDDLQDGTFTITNLGMYEMDSFSPIINQPQVAILGITAIKDEVTVKDGQIAILPMMNLCLTADHRAVDGAVAAEFMARLKEFVENPVLLFL